MKHVTRIAANLRAIIMILIAMLGAVLTDKDLLTYLAPWQRGLIGVAIAGLSVYRAWLDQSSSTAAGSGEPAPVQITGTDKPLPVTETPAPPQGTTQTDTPPDAPSVPDAPAPDANQPNQGA